eukprot:6258067-Pyramimonas_sp.AAC.1
MACKLEAPREHQRAGVAREALRDHGLRLLYAERFLEVSKDCPTTSKAVENPREQGVQAAQAATNVLPPASADKNHG